MLKGETEVKRDIQERTFKFACNIVRLQRDLRRHGVPGALTRQILRAGTSIGANMEEAEAAMSRADFVCKCRIALKEARETRYWLRLLDATGEVSALNVEPYVKETTELIAILTTIAKKSAPSRQS
jgi:four helix bundle protein